VVALVIREVPFEQVEFLVDLADQAELPGQQVDGSDVPGAMARVRSAAS
jgi:hypothetical protein